MQNSNECYMRRCLQLAMIGEKYVAPNPMVGAVLVKESIDLNGNIAEEIVGEGWHKQFGDSHAEVNCFRDAEQRGVRCFTDCTLYVSLEPCSHYGKTPPCALLIIEKKVKKVVIGMTDPNPKVSGKGIKMLKDAGIDVKVGVLEQACRQVNKRFVCLHEQHRPYVILKWAQTADGYIDNKRDITDTGQVGKQLVISNAVTKQFVHKMRAENMAIMVGTRTAILDNPSLKVTRWTGHNPIRLLLDRKNIVPANNRIYSDDAKTIVYKENTDFQYILSDLTQKNVNSVIVEGGCRLLEHIISTGIWDEAHIEISEHSIGNGIKGPTLPINNRFALDRKIGKSTLYSIYNKQ